MRDFFQIPPYIQVDITKVCNLSCYYCSANSDPEVEETDLAIQQWCDIIRYLVASGCLALTVSGGEPFLRRDLVFKILELTSGIITIINTNGWFIDREIAAELGRYKKVMMTMNIDGPDQQTHDYLRSRGSFEKVLEAIEALREVGLLKNLAINTVINRYNVENLEQTIELVQSLGVGEHRLLFMMPSGRGLDDRDNLLLSYNEMEEIIRRVQDKPVRFGHGLDFFYRKHDMLSEKNVMPICLAGKSSIVIDAKGDIYPCTYLRDDIFLVGNILQDDLKKLWSDSKILLELGKIPTPVDQECEDCPMRYLCSGGCRAHAYYMTGDYQARDPRCRLQK